MRQTDTLFHNIKAMTKINREPVSANTGSHFFSTNALSGVYNQGGSMFGISLSIIAFAVVLALLLI